MQEPAKKKLLLGGGIILGGSLICLAIVTLVFFRNLAIFIELDERGVVISPSQPPGYKREILEPGWHIIAPGERIQVYNIGRQIYTMSSPDSIAAKTLDGKTVFVDISVTYVLNPEKILEIHNNWQNRYESDLVRSQSRVTTRKILLLYNANELKTQVPQIEQSIFEVLEKQFSEHFLILLEFSIPSIQQP